MLIIRPHALPPPAAALHALVSPPPGRRRLAAVQDLCDALSRFGLRERAINATAIAATAVAAITLAATSLAASAHAATVATLHKLQQRVVGSLKGPFTCAMKPLHHLHGRLSPMSLLFVDDEPQWLREAAAAVASPPRPECARDEDEASSKKARPDKGIRMRAQQSGEDASERSSAVEAELVALRAQLERADAQASDHSALCPFAAGAPKMKCQDSYLLQAAELLASQQRHAQEAALL